ncbi:hypothetical protein HPB50_017226 [Hyalomma asiaticum]|uniref:Uncharacterized protein n=1 Tax=Hyalomma asiaticum TaxID=266040 RepID=A0ACB7TJL2_HYAAI|nr:hypothetical protein HPB50_017226 [Hyalomma asiaticum]
MEGGESVSEVGSVVWSSNGNVLSERQMEYHLKLAQERRQALELEVELARLHSTASSSSQERVGRAGEHSATSEWRKYAKILIGAFPKFPADAEVPVWFEAVEHTLEAYEVPRSCWGQIIFPLLAERVEYLATRLTPAQHRDYEALKEVVLDELKLSPLEYQKRFLGARKRKSETWKSFATRLGSYLNFYVNATSEAAPRRFNERRLLFQSLALGASALHLIQATRYLLKHRPGADGTDAADEATCGFVVETRIAKFKSRPPPIPPVPVRVDSSALQARRDSSAVASVAARRESTVVPSRRESSVAYPEYL